MDLVFEALTSNKAKVIAIVEADPYGHTSFSRNGYKVKDGTVVGEDKEKVYVFMKATDEFARFAKEALKDVAAVCAPEVAVRVSKKIEEEESNSQVGFGAIFG